MGSAFFSVLFVYKYEINVLWSLLPFSEVLHIGLNKIIKKCYLIVIMLSHGRTHSLERCLNVQPF